jgi:hypothetical protein
MGFRVVWGVSDRGLRGPHSRSDPGRARGRVFLFGPVVASILPVARMTSRATNFQPFRTTCPCPCCSRFTGRSRAIVPREGRLEQTSGQRVGRSLTVPYRCTHDPLLSDKQAFRAFRPVTKESANRGGSRFNMIARVLSHPLPSSPPAEQTTAR